MVRTRVLVLCGLLSLPLGGFAETYVGGVTPEEVSQVLVEMGYEAKPAIDNEGDPMVHSSSDGHPFSVYFYQLEAGRALSLQFSYGLDLEETSDERVAAWNREYSFGRAFVDDEGDPFLKMDLDVERGFTPAALENNFERWFSLVGEFYDYFNEPVPAL